MENENRKPQGLIVSDHFLLKLGLRTLLNVIGLEIDLQEASDNKELQEISKREPDFDYLIVDERLFTKGEEINCLKNIKKNLQCKILIIGERKLPDYETEQFISTCYNREKMIDSLQHFFYEPPENSDEDSEMLSTREIEVLKAVAMGYSNKEIADHLFISINTVITHRKNITGKLGIKTISGLTVYALMNRLIKPNEVTR